MKIEFCPAGSMNEKTKIEEVNQAPGKEFDNGIS